MSKTKSRKCGCGAAQYYKEQTYCLHCKKKFRQLAEKPAEQKETA